MLIHTKYLLSRSPDYGMICVKLEADMVQIGMRYAVNRAGFLVVLNKNL